MWSVSALKECLRKLDRGRREGAILRAYSRAVGEQLVGGTTSLTRFQRSAVSAS